MRLLLLIINGLCESFLSITSQNGTSYASAFSECEIFRHESGDDLLLKINQSEGL